MLPLAPPIEGRPPILLQTFLTVEEEFTDNANQTKENRKSEFRTSIAPGLVARVDRLQSSLDLVYSPRYFIRGSSTDDANFDHNLTLRSTWNPTAEIRLGLADDLTESTDFRDVQEGIGTRRTGTSSFLTNRGTLEAAYATPDRRIGLSYSNVFQQDNAPGADSSLTHSVRTDGSVTIPALNLAGACTLTRATFDIASPYWEYSLDGQATRDLTPALAASLAGWFSYYDKDRDPNLILGRTRVGGNGAFGPYGTFRAEVGLAVLAEQNSSTRATPSILLNWTRQFTLFTVTAMFRLDYQDNSQNITNTGVSQTAAAGVALTSSGLLSRDLTATVSGQWVANDYLLTVLGQNGVSSGTVDQTWNPSVEIRYLLLRGLSLVLGYTATLRTSTDPTAEFLENRVRFALTYLYDIL